MHGHNVNHIIVGNLGVLEIVLMACDDGDVIAYYTHTIQAAIKSPGNQPIRPFFHENVGISAWGLAVHSKSRCESFWKQSGRIQWLYSADLIWLSLHPLNPNHSAIY
jgi:hypothetical protein